MKILVLITCNKNSWHYIVSDSVEALRELGHKVFVTPILGYKDSIPTILKNIEEFKPDFVFTANNVGLCKEVLEDIKILIISWITTEPEVLLKLPPKEGLIYFVVGESYIDEMKRFGYRDVFTLPLAANPRIFKKVSLSRDDQERYGCDVSFAGGCNYDIWYKRHKEGIDRFFTKEIVDRLIERHSWNTSHPIVDHLIEILKEAKRIEGVDEKTLRDKLLSEVKEELIALHWAAMSKLRKDVIKGVSGFGVRIYGDEGWMDMIGTPGVSLYPFIEDRVELVKLYNATKINLNLPTSNHLTTSTFNLLSTGAFMLSIYNETLLKSFDEDEEVVCFKDLDDLKEKIGFYLLHPEERERIAKNAQRRVLEEHTFLHRMKEVLGIVNNLR